MRSSVYETSACPPSGSQTRRAARPTISCVFFYKAFEKDPVGTRVWQEGCSCVKLNTKAAFFFFSESLEENIVHPSYIFSFVLYMTHSDMWRQKFALVSSFFAERGGGGEGVISAMSANFTCLLNAENEMTRKEMHVLGRTVCRATITTCTLELAVAN